MPVGVCTGVKSKRVHSAGAKPGGPGAVEVRVVCTSEKGHAASFCQARWLSATVAERSRQRHEGNRCAGLPHAWRTLDATKRRCAGSVRSSAYSERSSIT